MTYYKYQKTRKNDRNFSIVFGNYKCVRTKTAITMSDNDSLKNQKSFAKPNNHSRHNIGL